MRVTTDLWVSALLRSVFSGGGFGAVISKGAVEAGVVFVVTRDRLGHMRFYGPAPQTSYDTAHPDERQFSPINSYEDSEDIDKLLERERRFDPDIWVVEIEAGEMDIEKLLTLTTS